MWHKNLVPLSSDFRWRRLSAMWDRSGHSISAFDTDAVAATCDTFHVPWIESHACAVRSDRSRRCCVVRVVFRDAASHFLSGDHRGNDRKPGPLLASHLLGGVLGQVRRILGLCFLVH